MPVSQVMRHDAMRALPHWSSFPQVPANPVASSHAMSTVKLRDEMLTINLRDEMRPHMIERKSNLLDVRHEV